MNQILESLEKKEFNLANQSSIQCKMAKRIFSHIKSFNFPKIYYQNQQPFTLPIYTKFLPSISKPMGHQTSAIEFPKNTWTEFKKQGNTCIYYNGNGSYAQKKSLTQDKKLEAREELLIYKERSQTILPIVKVYSVQLTEEKKNFCSTMHKMSVWVEYIPNRLTFVRGFTLSEVECLYVLQQSLTAFHELFKKFGYFEINSDMIGFNIEGKVKCWLNKCFENNRIENANESVLSNGDGSSNKNIEKMDKKLKESIQKSMVTDLWQITKRKSNIQSRDIYNKLSNLQVCNFQNASKLVDYLVLKSQTSIPSSLIFQNCLQYNKNKYQQFSYGNVYDEQHSVTKTVQIYDVQLVQNGILNFNFWPQEPNFRDFDTYRQHIDSLRPKKVNKSDQHINISFETLPRFDTKKSDNPESNTQKKIAKNALKLVDKTIDISLSSIPQNPSNKTIQDQSEPTIKKIDSQENLFLPLGSNLQKTYSVLVPNATSERYILNDVNMNQSRVVPLMRSMRVNCPIEKNVIAEHAEPVTLENYPLLYKKSSSRYPLPPPIAGIVVRQTGGYPNEPNTPQFNKLGYY